MEKISYITNPDLLRKSINEAESIIEKTGRVLVSNGDGIGDYKLYVAKGTDYKVRERVEVTEKYLTETNAPQWLWNGYKQRSVESLGIELLTYYNMLQGYIPMRITLNGETLTLDADTDITITEDGKWEASEALRKKIRERYTRTLTDEQMQDFELLNDFLSLYRKLLSKGYDADAKKLYAIADTPTRANAFLNCYIPYLDERIDADKREQMRLRVLGYVK